MYTGEGDTCQGGNVLAASTGQVHDRFDQIRKSYLLTDLVSPAREKTRLTATCPHCQVSQAFGAETTVNA